MPLLDVNASTLLLIDLQARLVPAIEGGLAVVANARRLLRAAGLFGAPVLFTEQNPKALGSTLAELDAGGAPVVAKMTFDAAEAPGVRERLAQGHTLILAGVEAHVCVLQTALGLAASGRRVAVVADAVGSRRPESREIALRRMEANGVEIVTTEMVVFEWLRTAEHPRFREASALIK